MTAPPQDVEDIRELVAGILGDEGHETRTAHGADSAVDFRYQHHSRDFPAMAAGLSSGHNQDVDAGLDLGKTEAQSLVLLRASDQLAGLGYPLLLSASNKRFIWTLLEVERGQTQIGTMAAHALGITLGCRVLRAHDAREARRVADVTAALLAAREAAVS